MPRVVPSEVVAFIDRAFPWAADEIMRSHEQSVLTSGHLGTVATLVNLVHGVPEELLVLQGELYIAFLAGVSALRAAVQAWQTRTSYPIAQVQGLPDLHVVTLIRRALAACPDQFPSKDTTELAFIPDKKLRESLCLDISSANQALSNGNWKAATVLAGSVIEALLLWALQRSRSDDVQDAVVTLVKNKALRQSPKGALEEWHLLDYIEVAAQLNVIKPRTADQARLAKEFRNLIHPGREARLRQTCDLGTALSAIAAVEHVVRDLDSWPSNQRSSSADAET